MTDCKCNKACYIIVKVVSLREERIANVPAPHPPTPLLFCTRWPLSVSSICASGPKAVKPANVRDRSQLPLVQSWAGASNLLIFRPLGYKVAAGLRVADLDRRVRRELTCVCLAIYKHPPADSVVLTRIPLVPKAPKVKQRTKSTQLVTIQSFR